MCRPGGSPNEKQRLAQVLVPFELIGKAISERLAESGANVTLMARDEKKLNEIVQSLDKKQGQSHKILVVDFSDYNNFSKIISTFFSKNKIDILINNTQGPPAGGAIEKNIDSK